MANGPPPQIRHILRELLPPWLRGPMGDSLLTEGLFTIYDLDSEIMRDALLVRFPSYAPTDALPLIAADRGIPTGGAEDPAVLRARLLLWIDLLQLVGLPFGMMLFIQAVLSPYYGQIRIFTAKSLWYDLDSGAVGRLLEEPGFTALPPAPYELGPQWPPRSPAIPIERLRFEAFHRHDESGAPNVDWDSRSLVPGSVARFAAWVVIYSDGAMAWCVPKGKWGATGQKWGTKYKWGIDAVPGVDPDIGDLLRRVVKQAKPAGCWIRSVIVSFSEDRFDPTQPAGIDVNPDGYFGRNSKVVGGVYVASRFSDCRFGGQVI